MYHRPTIYNAETQMAMEAKVRNRTFDTPFTFSTTDLCYEKRVHSTTTDLFHNDDNNEEL